VQGCFLAAKGVDMEMQARNEDSEHLKLLSVFHYVVAGLLALIGCCPVFHLILGGAILSGAMEEPGRAGPPRAVGLIVIAMALIFMVIPWALAGAVALAGWKLSRRKSHTYCLVCAALMCMFMPVGTVLGVFTIMVLMRPTVKAMFEESGSVGF
jgi:hypothetical protein